MLVLLLVGLLIYWDNSMSRIPAFAEEERPAQTPGQDWLLVGSDSRENLTEQERAELSTGAAEGRRTDTIMLVHIPDGSAPPTLVSLPRDSYVEIPGEGENKLNAAYAIGGAPLLTQTVEHNTDIRIDRYAEIGFGGFADMVDAVGGVDICVKEPIDDPLAGLNLQPGCQELDGKQALGYVRTRATPRADLERVERQRAFLGALVDKVTSPSVLLNPLRSVPLGNDGIDALHVDQGAHLWHLARLGFGMREISGGTGVTTTVPIGGAEDTDAGSAILWDDDLAPMLWDALRTDRPVPPGAIVQPPG